MKDERMPMAEMLIAGCECEEAGKKPPPIRAERAMTESDELPSLPPETIGGIIRKGGKLPVVGASKAGKSYLLIELAIAVATGGWWLGFRCAKGRILYVSLEIQKPQFMHRVYNVAKAVGAREMMNNSHPVILSASEESPALLPGEILRASPSEWRDGNYSSFP